MSLIEKLMKRCSVNSIDKFGRQNKNFDDLWNDPAYQTRTKVRWGHEEVVIVVVFLLVAVVANRLVLVLRSFSPGGVRARAQVRDPALVPQISDRVAWTISYNFKLSWPGAVEHRGSIISSHPAALGLIRGIPKSLSWCCWDLANLLVKGKCGQRLDNVDRIQSSSS